MARNKNSTALFDVIHAAKKPPKPSPSASIPTPKWWGKDRKQIKKVPQSTPQTATENVGRQQSWLTAAKKNGVAPVAAVASVPTETVSDATTDAPLAGLPATAGLVTDPVQTADVAAAPASKVRFIDRFVNRTAPASGPSVDPAGAINPAPEPVAAEQRSTGSTVIVDAPEDGWTDSEFVQVKPTANAQSKPEPTFRVDPSAKEFRINFSYGGMMAVGFIFMMALAIAFIAGRHSVTETADTDTLTNTNPTGTNTTGSGLMAALTSNPPTPGDKPSHPAEAQISPTVIDVAERPAKSKPDPAAAPAPLLPLKTTRDIGMEYVIIQSYDDQALAEKACAFVNQNSDIKCTVVQGPSDWAPHNWYSVIGLQQFGKHDPALPEYERKIRLIGAKFSTNVLNQFDPKAYTWRTDSDMAQ